MPDKKDRDASWNTGFMIRHAKSLQRVVEKLGQNGAESPQSDPFLFTGTILAGPILLSLAIEIALKAWQCREQGKAPDRIHDLLKLFNGLEQETQEMLEAKMRKVSPYSVWAGEPRMQNLNSDLQDMLGARMHPLSEILRSHCDANVKWRYIYENPQTRFETAELDRALTVIIGAYDKDGRCS